MRTMETCSARREGELTAHESSRAEGALVVVVVVVDDGGGLAMVEEEVIVMLCGCQFCLFVVVVGSH